MNYKGKNNAEEVSNDSKLLKSLDSAQDLAVKGSKFRPVGAAVTLGVKPKQSRDNYDTLYHKSLAKGSSAIDQTSITHKQ